MKNSKSEIQILFVLEHRRVVESSDDRRVNDASLGLFLFLFS